MFPYWPQKASLKTGEFIVEAAAVTTYGDYILREIKLTNTEVIIYLWVIFQEMIHIESFFKVS